MTLQSLPAEYPPVPAASANHVRYLYRGAGTGASPGRVTGVSGWENSLQQSNAHECGGSWGVETTWLSGKMKTTKCHLYFNGQCFIFHDVDLLPEDDRNLYTCPIQVGFGRHFFLYLRWQPRHMSVSIDSFLYRLPYDDIFGGVSAMTVDQYQVLSRYLVIGITMELRLLMASPTCSGAGVGRTMIWPTGWGSRNCSSADTLPI